jgi:hypothetical protein
MADIFVNHSAGLESPASRLVAVTPSDSADLAFVSRALNVAVAGPVRLTTLGGDTVTVQIAAGIAFPVRAQRVWQTGTTATGIVAMF